MSTEDMIRAYLDATRSSMYPGYTIENLQTAGQYVMFNERSKCANYVEQHQIELLDVVAWVYSQLGDSK